MEQREHLISQMDRLVHRLRKQGSFIAPLGAVGIALASVSSARATENVPHRPFGQWAELPAPGEWVAGIVYEESEAYHIFVKGASYNVTYHSADGESYGIDINRGYIALQYGISDRWAADLNVGGTGS